jgi:hypothetical protein
MALVLVCIGAQAQPALAVDLLAARGRINVDPDFRACGTVTFGTTQSTITGAMTAVGFGSTGDNQENATVRDVAPITEANTQSATVCTEGLNFIRTPEVASVTYKLVAAGPSGETTVVKHCVRVQATFQCQGA